MNGKDHLKQTVVETNRRTKIHIYITNVFKGNFNDETYLFDKDIFLDELKGKPPVWFDPYFGRSKVNDTQVAILRVNDEGFCLLKNQNGETEEKESLLGNATLVEDFDENRLLASHIELC